MHRRATRFAAGAVATVCAVSIASAAVYATDRNEQQPASTSASVQQAPRPVVRRDVDGDGRRDRVYLDRRGHGRVLLRVDRARGKTLHKVAQVEYWHGSPWHGAASIDKRDGVELVLGYTSGAHTLLFRTWTYRTGRLVLLDAPGRGDAWVVDGSYSANIGVWRRSPDQRVFVVVRTALRDRDGKGHHGSVRTYRWSDGRWKLSRHVQRRWHDRGAFRLGGWHVRGLPRF